MHKTDQAINLIDAAALMTKPNKAKRTCDGNWQTTGSSCADGLFHWYAILAQIRHGQTATADAKDGR